VLPHAQEVRSLAVSDDGTLVATGSDDGTVRIWDSRGELRHVLHGHDDLVSSLRFRPRTHEVFSGSGDHTVRTWDAATGEERHAPREFSDRVTALVFSPDGSRFAVGTVDGTTVVCPSDAPDQELVSLASARDVSALAFDPSGDSLLVGDVLGRLQRWDLDSARVVRAETFPRGTIHDIAYGPSIDGAVRLFVAVGNLALEVHPERLVMMRAFAAHDGIVTSLAVSPEGDRLVTASVDYTVRMWDVETGANTVTFVGHEKAVNAVAFIPGTPRFVTGSEDETARIWLSGTEAVMTLEHDDDWVTAVAFSHDGSRLAVASRAGRIRVWNARSGALLESIPTPRDVYCLAWTKDARLVFGGFDPALRILTPGASTPWEVLRASDLFASAIDVDPDTGRILARYQEHSAYLWNPGEAKPSIVIEGLDDASSAAFHPSGATFATGSLDGSVAIRSAVDGGIVASLDDARSPITAIAYSVDGSRIAAGTRDRAILIWSTRTERLLRTLNGHENQITSLAFSPDGKRLASGSVDKTIRLWDPGTGEALLTLREHESGITAVAFSPDGTQIASASKDGTVRLWRTPAAIAGP